MGARNPNPRRNVEYQCDYIRSCYVCDGYGRHANELLRHAICEYGYYWAAIRDGISNHWIYCQCAYEWNDCGHLLVRREQRELGNIRGLYPSRKGLRD